MLYFILASFLALLQLQDPGATQILNIFIKLINRDNLPHEKMWGRGPTPHCPWCPYPFPPHGSPCHFPPLPFIVISLSHHFILLIPPVSPVAPAFCHCHASSISSPSPLLPISTPWASCSWWQLGVLWYCGHCGCGYGCGQSLLVLQLFLFML